MRGRGQPQAKRGNSGAPPGFATKPPGPSSSSSPPPSSSSPPPSSRVDPSLFRPTKALTPSPSPSSPLALAPSPFASITPDHLSAYPISFLPFLPADPTPSASLLLRCSHSDLTSLLSLPTFPFLSHCVHDASLHVFLSSFLHHVHVEKPPSSDYSEPLRLAFLAFHRLTSSSPTRVSLSSLPPSFPSIPLLLDLSAIYAASNRDHCTAIITRLLTSIPSLIPAFSNVLDGLVSALSSVQSTLALPVPVAVLTGSVGWLLDCYGTLLAFVLSGPAATLCPLFVKPGFLTVTARLYERVTGMIGEQRGSVEDMRALRRVMMSLVHRCVDYAWIQPLLRESGDVRSTSHAFTGWVEETAVIAPALLAHYSQLYGLSKALSTMAGLPTVKPHLPSSLQSKLPAPPSAVPVATASLLRSTSTQQREEDDAVQTVWAMLEGEVSEDFARAVLREYDGDVSRAVDGIFSGALPPRLESVTRDKRREWRDGESGYEEERDLLGDEESNDAFQSYLLRTGRVLKSDSEALSRSSLSVFEDRTDRELLKERILASTAEEGYDDEFDDSYDDFLSFKVDETAVDAEGERPVSRPTRDTSAVREDIREKWRREEAERDKRREEDQLKRIEQIPPSRRTEEEKRDWERLTQTQQPTAPSPSTRGMRGSRGRGAASGRGGMGRADEPSTAASAPSLTSAPTGRGRGRGAMVVMSSEEREAQRLRRFEESQKEKQRTRSRIYSDEEEDEEAEGDQPPDSKAETAEEDGDGASSQQTGEGGEGGRGGRGGRGRGGRGWGAGPRGSRGSGRGGSHNRKFLAAKKMNSGLR